MNNEEIRAGMVIRVAIEVLVISIVIFLFGVLASPAQAEKATYLRTSGAQEWDVDLIEDLQRGLNDNLKVINKASGKKFKKLTVDGSLGPKTITMLKWFQKGKGLTPDGICGPKTWRALGYDHTEKVYYAPDLFEAFNKGTSDYAFVLTLDTHKFRVYEIKEDGWELIYSWKAATGDSSKGYFTPVGTWVLSKSGNHSEISGSGWAADDATFIAKNQSGYFYVHSVLKHKKKGRWVYDDDSCLGTSCTHGCVRLSRDNAKWVAKHRNGTVLVVLDRDPIL